MRYRFFLLLPTLILWSGLSAAETQPANLDALIKQLGATDFSAREDAQLKLAAQGERAREVLTQATKSTDPEIAATAATLLDRINRAVVAVQVQDSAGKPLADVAVIFNINLREGNRAIAVRRNEAINTDAEGWACVGDLKPERGYMLNMRLQMPGYLPAMANQQSQELKVGRHEFKLVALRCAQVKGEMLLKDRVPLADGRVGLVPTNQLAMLDNQKQMRFILRRLLLATTDAHGQFVFEQVAPGEYVLVLVNDEKVLFRGEPVRVEAEETVTLNGLAADVDPRSVKPHGEVLQEEPVDEAVP